ncbi:hypothetical protein L1987_01713 [Smallanthus sonchifolius]|uniref:Uncharacterized protein n=1 Tax=Smallanthus sonchifolius TaxID=185202 RepID=A0ACB9K5X1_9ASTR|nr:hypothetical protein L1987_01713 [Smallanthus sonchifolius]
MEKRMVNLPATFEKLLPFGILLTNLFKNIQIELGPPKVLTLKTLSLNSIIGELHLPFPLSSMLSSMDVKKHFEELLKEHTRLLNAILDQYEELKNKIEENSSSIKRNNSLLEKMYNFMKKALPNCSRSPFPSPSSSR